VRVGDRSQLLATKKTGPATCSPRGLFSKTDRIGWSRIARDVGDCFLLTAGLLSRARS